VVRYQYHRRNESFYWIYYDDISYSYDNIEWTYITNEDIHYPMSLHLANKKLFIYAYQGFERLNRYGSVVYYDDGKWKGVQGLHNCIMQWTDPTVGVTYANNYYFINCNGTIYATSDLVNLRPWNIKFEEQGERQFMIQYHPKTESYYVLGGTQNYYKKNSSSWTDWTSFTRPNPAIFTPTSIVISEKGDILATGQYRNFIHFKSHMDNVFSNNSRFNTDIIGSLSTIDNKFILYGSEIGGLSYQTTDFVNWTPFKTDYNFQYIKYSVFLHSYVAFNEVDNFFYISRDGLEFDSFPNTHESRFNMYVDTPKGILAISENDMLLSTDLQKWNNIALKWQPRSVAYISDNLYIATGANTQKEEDAIFISHDGMQSWTNITTGTCYDVFAQYYESSKQEHILTTRNYVLIVLSLNINPSLSYVCISYAPRSDLTNWNKIYEKQFENTFVYSPVAIYDHIYFLLNGQDQRYFCYSGTSGSIYLACDYNLAHSTTFGLNLFKDDLILHGHDYVAKKKAFE